MTKQQYKNTEIGEIPEEWEVVRLGEGADYFKGKKPSVILDIPKENYEPYLTAETMRTGTFDKWCEINTDVVRVKNNDVIFIWDGSYSGDVFTGFHGALVSTMVKIEPKQGNLGKKFLFYFLKTKFKLFNSTTTGTSIPHVSKSVFTHLKIPLPPLPEQRKIAEILSTVDGAIQKTDEIIQKTKELKKGLMQQLLTRGIRHVKFKQTEIGEIPAEWEVVRLGEAVEKVRQVDPRKNPDREFRYIGVSGISNEFFKIIDSKGYIGKDAPHRARKPIKEHDIIFATVRPYLKRAAIVPIGFDGQICSTAFTVVRCLQGIVDYKFVFYYLLTDRVIDSLTEIQRGSNYPAVSDNDVYNLKLPLHPLPEQRKIAEILSAVDEKIEMERRRKEKLEELKKGLMQVLLTGKVRVKESLESIESIESRV